MQQKVVKMQITDIQYIIKTSHISRICVRRRVCPQIRAYFMGYIEKLRQKNQNPVINWKCHISPIFRRRKQCRFDMGTAISFFKQITDEFLLSPRSPFTLGLRSCMDTSSGFQLSLKNLFSLKLKICMNTISGFLMSLKGPVFLELQNCMNNLFGFPLNQKNHSF